MNILARFEITRKLIESQLAFTLIGTVAADAMLGQKRIKRFGMAEGAHTHAE